MTISMLLMILAVTAGPGISKSVLSNSSTSATSTKPPSEPDHNCWVNGTWYNPCPGNSPWDPEPPPDMQPQN